MKINALAKNNYIFFFFGMLVLLFLIELSIRMKFFVMGTLTELNTPFFLKNNLAGFISFTFIVLPLLIAELLLPNDEENQSHKHGIVFWILSIQGNFFISLLSVEILKHYKLGPIFNLSFTSLSAESFLYPVVLNFLLVVLALFTFDFFYYWFHRMQHTFFFFWEFHKTHHSIKNLNTIVSYHHVLEELFRIPFITLPLATLIHIDTPKLAILSSFFAVYGQFIHMNSKISLGPLRLVLADNYYHRIHHSVEEDHHNKNYAAFFPIWDILFKTVHFPKFNEFPKVGLDDMDQPTTISSYLFSPRPFGKRVRSRSGMGKA